jgi:DNA-binding response OmpR family regulator
VDHLPTRSATALAPRVLLGAAPGPERDALERALRRARLEVHVVEHGAAALDGLRAGAYGAAVLSAELPGLGGAAVCRWTRAHGEQPALALVLLGSAEHADGAGASAVLPPSARPRLVADRVRALLRDAEPPAPRSRALARALVLRRSARGRGGSPR